MQQLVLKSAAKPQDWSYVKEIAGQNQPKNNIWKYVENTQHIYSYNSMYQQNHIKTMGFHMGFPMGFPTSIHQTPHGWR